MSIRIHPSWLTALSAEWEKPYWKSLTDFVRAEYESRVCFPEGRDIFRAFDLTPLDQVRVVILGQDPYHTRGAAMGMAFSIPSHPREESMKNPPSPLYQGGNKTIGQTPLPPLTGGQKKIQPSLRNIFKELKNDLDLDRVETDLTDWAEQGVLLLNTSLTVREGLTASHSGHGWEVFTDAVISTISTSREGVVFILWGAHAISKQSLIDESRHHIISSHHPSPFSAHRGFFGSHPFSRTNEYLQSRGGEPIRW